MELEFKVYHNSHQEYYRKPFGAVPCGGKVVLRIEITGERPIEQCLLRTWEKERYEKHIQMECVQKVQEYTTKWIFECIYRIPEEPGLVWYYFLIRILGHTYYYGNNADTLGGVGELAEHEPPSYQITVYQPTEVPQWFKEGIMYQIFVDRFFNGNENSRILNPKPKSLLHGNWEDTPFYIKDAKGRVVRWTFFGGNLQGIISKLPYFEELGISILYLNPIFEAASNHKYDTGDYLKIDPMYGDQDTLTRLVREAEKYGIAIILDGVFSHTGSDSIYFNRYGNYPQLGAFQSEESPYHTWYQFKGSADEYECWWGVDDLPNVDEMDPSYQGYIYQNEDSVIQTWMKEGIRGWRLDVVDELPDEFVKGLKKAVRTVDPQAVLIGEVWEDASRKVSYGKLREYFWGDELDSVMNYPLRSMMLDFFLGKTDAAVLAHKIISLYENYPRENFLSLMNIIGSHDRARILTLLGEAPLEESLSEKDKEHYRLSPDSRRNAVQRLKLLSLLQMTLPGVPCVYYGDEVGVEGYSDPYNRSTFPWGREDPEIRSWYKRLLWLRKEYDVFRKGEFQPFHDGKDVFGFFLGREDDAMIVYVNRHMTNEVSLTIMDENTRFGAKAEAESGIGRPAVHLPAGGLILDILEGTKIEDKQIRLKPLEGKVIYIKNRIIPKMERCSGILLHITSLPSSWGIGDLGEEARKFVDFMAASKQSLWQILPLNPPGEGDTPYQSTSVFAGNPFLISLEDLKEEGLLSEGEVRESKLAMAPENQDVTQVNYASIQERKDELLRKAFLRFQSHIKKEENTLSDVKHTGKYLSLDTYRSFLEESRFWLEDYCLYYTLKELKANRPWYTWEQPSAERQKEVLFALQRDHRERLDYQKFLQYTFFYQWQKLKKYANNNGVKIIGDLPIYVAGDSCDTWVYRRFFKLDKEGKPLAVAGVPPDYFSETGQLWGNPLYQWRDVESENFFWWRERVRHALKMFDYTRLDHFRGFEGYWQVPADEKNAVNGRWLKGPGSKFFNSLEAEFGTLPFLAEDLGLITPEVHNLKHLFGFPGMKVYQFSDLHANDFQNDLEETILFSGTHDNDTLMGWYRENHGEGLSTEDIRVRCREIITGLYHSDAPWVILPLQDVLMLESDARMNTPGTVEGNWRWRMKNGDLTQDISNWLKMLVQAHREEGHK